MAKAGKKYQEACKLVEEGKLYTAAEAMDLVKKTATAKFDESIELHVRLGVDPKYPDQQVRGAIVLPARPDAQQAPNQVFLPMHWGGEYLGGRASSGQTLAGVNALTTPERCPQSKQPELLPIPLQFVMR